MGFLEMKISAIVFGTTPILAMVKGYSDTFVIGFTLALAFFLLTMYMVYFATKYDIYGPVKKKGKRRTQRVGRKPDTHDCCDHDEYESVFGE